MYQYIHKAFVGHQEVIHFSLLFDHCTVCYQVVFEVAFNSARGGYVAIDDISFSPEFCHRDTGKKDGTILGP